MQKVRFLVWVVSTHSRPKAAGINHGNSLFFKMFQHTAARRRLETDFQGLSLPFAVSTHSRPKAAGGGLARLRKRMASFNTQPPEGGWIDVSYSVYLYVVSTHSRPKAAGALPVLKAV